MIARGKTIAAAVVGLGFVAHASSRLVQCGATPLGSWALALMLVAVLLLIWRKVEFDGWLGATLVCATSLYLVYASYTGLDERNYDGLAHHWYANYIATHGSLPKASACVVCWHPPLYYALSALTIRVALASRTATPECMLQFLTLLLCLSFLTFGTLLIREVTRHRAAQRAGVALLAFWPTTVINSIRVHDDALLSATAAGVLYFTVRLKRHRRRADLAAAVGFAAAAVLTKANAYAWAILPTTLLVFQGVRERWNWPSFKRALFSVAAIALATSGAVGWRAIGNGSACHRAVGVICDLSREHFVGNRWVNYLKLDVRFFLREPFLINDPYDKAKDYVLNNLLKTSLLNAIPLGPKFEDRLSAGLATAFGVLMIGLASFMLVGLRHVRAEHWRRYSVLLMAAGFALGQLLALRIYAPLAMHADFRYVYPVLVPATIYYAKLLEPESGQGLLLRWFGLCIAGAFVIGSIVFFRPSSERTHQPDTPSSVGIRTALTDVSTVRETGTAIKGNAIRFGAHQFLEFQLPEPMDVSRIDLSVDADDQYRVLVISPTFSRVLWIGPTLSTHGLVRMVRDLPFPLPNVTRIEIQPNQGDADYAVGHLITE